MPTLPSPLTSEIGAKIYCFLRILLSSIVFLHLPIPLPNFCLNALCAPFLFFTLERESLWRGGKDREERIANEEDDDKIDPLESKLWPTFEDVLQEFKVFYFSFSFPIQTIGGKVKVKVHGAASWPNYTSLLIRAVTRLGSQRETLRNISQVRQSSAGIWSVGCTAIEMAMARPPWNKQYEEFAALYHIGTTKYHPPIPDHLSVEEEDFLLKCLPMTNGCVTEEVGKDNGQDEGVAEDLHQ
ncbi:hypothetical protein Vadar_019329 [Vaccinium darrowii]|uniref:Uncharacterized protein n=1 Tax=Vaccinium darrowii TaxID=229202 RepID=A0ACB7XIM5_9ERIC|nr:hypothetical protein Vadar_019329 [Vaccinium darrowii]